MRLNKKSIQFLCAGFLITGGLFWSSLGAPPPEVKVPEVETVKKVEEVERRLDKEEAKIAWQYIGTRTVTAYSSTVDQCDGDPFTTAYSTQVRQGIVASNEFARGTKLKIAGKEYVVEDRTNGRYSYRLDIWFPTRQEAIEFGRQSLEIYEKIVGIVEPT